MRNIPHGLRSAGGSAGGWLIVFVTSHLCIPVANTAITKSKLCPSHLCSVKIAKGMRHISAPSWTNPLLLHCFGFMVFRLCAKIKAYKSQWPENQVLVLYTYSVHLLIFVFTAIPYPSPTPA